MKLSGLHAWFYFEIAGRSGEKAVDYKNRVEPEQALA
jgi:hypothetical protein